MDTNVTFEQKGDPFQYLVPAYRVSAVTASPYEGLDYWSPVSELGRPDHTRLTVMFIESCRILYTGPSNDYIFPASDRITDG